jgi:nucleotide sugar dehydrogenase
MKPGSLIMVETTVPPGTCEKLVQPILAESLKERGLPENSILLSHSYERVMPGKDYFDSIVNFWRVYSGFTTEAADACEAFLSKVINVTEYPLKRLHSTTASEAAKVLENSYRAVNIAFMEEWGRFAEAVGIDMFEIVNAIRKRPTHSNIRQPGFGVGGYCLTKDPLFAEISAREFYGLNELKFPFCHNAVEVNRVMPLVSLDKIKVILGEDLSKTSILLLGISYRQDVGDTRYSPSEVFTRSAQDSGATVFCHDPLIDEWPEMGLKIPQKIPESDGIDVVVFAVPHKEYQELNISSWINGANPLVLDANNVLTKKQREEFHSAGCKVISIGRGIV